MNLAVTLALTATAFARFATFLAVVVLAGLPVIHVLVIRPGLSGLGAGEDRTLRADLAGRLALAIDVGLVSMALGTIAGLVGLLARVSDIAEISGRGGVGQVVGAAASTHAGTWMLLRLGLVIGLAVTVRPGLRDRLARPASPDPAPGPDRFWLIWAAFATAMLLAVVETGHSAGLPRPWLAIPLGVAHLAATSVWLAGVAVLVVAVPSALRHRRERTRSAVTTSTIAAFSRVAFVAAVATVGTGIARSVLVLDGWPQLRETGYGQALVVKVWLFAWVLALGGYNRFILMRRLRASEPERAGGRRPARDDRAQAGQAVSALLALEFALGLLVIGATAALTGIAPPR